MTENELARRIQRELPRINDDVSAALEAKGLTSKTATDKCLTELLTKAVRKYTGDKEVVCEIKRPGH